MRKNTMIGLIAMLLVIISTFLPMISGDEIIEKATSLWSGEVKDNSTVAIIILIIALLMGLFSYLSNKKHLFSIGTLIFSGILLLISMKWFRDLNEAGDTVKMGMGMILFLGGSGLGLISAVLGFMKK